MKRKTSILAALLVAFMSAFAAINIDPVSRSFEFSGGGAIISTSGEGTWSAVSDVDWLTVSIASGNAGKGCAYLVEANNTADVRVGHITVSGNIYTVTQSGRSVELAPASIEVDSAGGSGEIAVTTDANVSWTVRANDSWITVSPKAGMGAAVLTYSIQHFDGVGGRSGTIAVGSQTIAVTQTGIDVNLTPNVTNVPYTVTLIPVIVDAMAETAWTVKANDPWLSVVDAGTGRGGSQVMIAAAENPSFEKRTGTVSIGTGKITVVQDGTSDLSFKILPEVATASPLGAFGNVAVYATPDATWTAESLVDWLHISSGAEGAGNGNVKYVVNSNPDLTPRTGVIRFTPPAYIPDVDPTRGLLCWIKDKVNIEGNDERKTTLSLSTVLDGSSYISMSGASLPDKENEAFAIAVSFKVGQVDCINRLLHLGGRGIYISDENYLTYDSTTGTRSEILYDNQIAANTWYTFVLNYHEAGKSTVFCGKMGTELSGHHTTMFGSGVYNSIKNISAIRFGYSSTPTAGNLLSGQFANIRIWGRTLTDRECETVDTNQNCAKKGDCKPLGAPTGVAWDYYPCDGTAHRVSNTNGVPFIKGAALGAYVSANDRYDAGYSALQSGGTGKLTIKNFENMFAGSCILNNGVTLGSGEGHFGFHVSNSSIYYPFSPTTVSGSEEDATYVLWLKVEELPDEGTAVLLSRELANYKNESSEKAYQNVYPQSDNISLNLGLNASGKLVLSGSGIETKTFAQKVTTGDWHNIAVVGRSKKSISLYLDGVELGNISSTMTLGYIPPTDARYYISNTYAHVFEERGEVKAPNMTFTVGGWSGAVDALCFYHTALSAAQVKKQFEEQQLVFVNHTVTQGVVEPTLSIDSAYMPKHGGNTNVTLTVAKGVNWTAKTSAAWLTIVGDTSGTGPADFTIKVAANPTVVERVGTVTIAGKTVTITQEGLSCEVIYSNPTFDVAGSAGSITVNPEGGGSWTANTDDDWIYIISGTAGTGSGEVLFITEQFLDTKSSRTGIITIGEEKVYITQRGYQLSIDPLVAEIGGNAGAGRIGVAADPDAIWTAIAQEDWITIVTGGEGIGDGSILYTVTDNTTGETRTGHIYISGQLYTITQTCTLKLSASVIGNGSVNGAGDYSQGKEVTLRAVPDAGNVFSHWSGDVVGNDEVTTVKMDSVKNVTATFIPEAAAQKIAEQKAAQGGYYTRDQIHALEMGNIILDVDASGTARVGVQLMETSNLSDPNSWKPATLSANPDIGDDGTVGMKVKAEGNAKFFKVVMPEQK